MFETESEAWTAIADTMEMICDMPPYDDVSLCIGLCDIIYTLAIDGLIIRPTYYAMERRIASKLKGLHMLAAVYDHATRIPIARQFAEDSK